MAKRRSVDCYKSSKSGYRGVVWNKKHKRWYARIGINGVRKFLGAFDTAEAAHRAYKEALIDQIPNTRIGPPIDRKEYLRKYAKAWRPKNRGKLRFATRLHKFRLKEQLVKAYGGKCVCCGETAIEFLTIDHINGKGAEHRRQLGSNTASGSNFYRWLRNNGFPKDNFQLLCYNCNCSKGMNGYCPHKIISSKDVE